MVTQKLIGSIFLDVNIFVDRLNFISISETIQYSKYIALKLKPVQIQLPRGWR